MQSYANVPISTRCDNEQSGISWFFLKYFTHWSMFGPSETVEPDRMTGPSTVWFFGTIINSLLSVWRPAVISTMQAWPKVWGTQCSWWRTWVSMGNTVNHPWNNLSDISICGRIRELYIHGTTRKLGRPSWSSLCFSRYWGGGSWGK